MSYNTKLGYDLLRKNKLPLYLAQDKWPNVLPPNFEFNWTNVWTSERASKEAFLMWQICHKGVAVNEWRGRISIHADKTCSTCDNEMKELVAHRF